MESVTTKPKKAKKKEWASHDVIWFALNSDVIIAYSTVAASNLIEVLAQDSPTMTISELHDTINYDLEAKKVLKAYIKYGYGDFIAWDYFGKFRKN